MSNWMWVLFLLGLFLLVVLLFRKPLHKQAYRLFFNWVLQDKEVPIKKVNEIKAGEKLDILDTRAPKEFEVSHIEGARRFGFEKKQWHLLDEVGKEDTILAYCTVGYRSQQVVKELREKGYENVYNLKGGLFEWMHRGRPIFRDGQRTKAVHTYNRSWGMWLSEGEKVYE